MSLLRFIRLILDNIKLLIAAPLIVSALVYFLLHDQQKSYSSTTKVYTGFASGYSIGQDGSRDYFSIKTKFDNLFETLKSRNTKKEISLKTMAYYLAQDTIRENDLSRENQELFQSFFTEEKRKEIGCTKDVDENFQNLLTVCNSNNHNDIYYLLNSQAGSNHPLGSCFSIDQLSNSLMIYQESASDLVTITYTATDAGICFNMLKNTIEVVTENVKVIKSIESNDVVAYYEKATRDAKRRLNIAEDELSDFMNSNRVINYYEETKLISARKENFEQNRQDEKLLLVSKEAKVIDLESEISQKDRQKLTNGKILQLRRELASVKSNIAVIEVQKAAQFGADNDNRNLTQSEITKKEEIVKALELLKARAVDIQNDLEEQVSDLFRSDPLTKGNSRKDVAMMWLTTVLNIEESKARLKQYDIFSREFDETYSRFSKLGSKIKRIERKIGVIEQEYLEMLSALNDAKMRQKSLELSQELKIVDDPFFPVSPEKSKLKLIMAIGAMATFLIVLTIVILLDYFDKSIRTFERFKKFTGLDVLGGFSIINVKRSLPIERLKNILIKQMVSAIQLLKSKAVIEPNSPFIVSFFSTKSQEGKTQLSCLIAESLRSSGKKVLVLNSSTTEDRDWPLVSDHADNFIYDLDQVDWESLKIQDLIENKWATEDFDYIFIEIPALIGNSLPISIIKSAHLSCIVAKANRIWARSDSKALEDFQKIVMTPIRSILNGAANYDLEEIIGEVPQKRTLIRRKIKELVSFKFKRNRF